MCQTATSEAVDLDKIVDCVIHVFSHSSPFRFCPKLILLPNKLLVKVIGKSLNLKLILLIDKVGLSYNTKGEENMKDKTPKPGAYFLLITILLAVGAGGLIYLGLSTEPSLGPRWMFFFFLMFFGTGLALPISILFNHRFPSDPPVGENVIYREALLFGGFITLWAWLSHGRLNSAGLTAIIFFGFAAVEVFTRLWEKGKGKTR